MVEEEPERSSSFDVSNCMYIWILFEFIEVGKRKIDQPKIKFSYGGDCMYNSKLQKSKTICVWLNIRDLSIIGLLLFTIPRIFNTKNDTIQYQKTIPPKNIFFKNFIAFLAISDNSKHFLKIPIFGPKKGAHYGNLGWKSPFGGF